MMVWDDPEVPTASLREPLVARLDERQGVSPFVVDYRDIHLERYVIDGQEYNVAHQALASFESLLQSILDGRRDNTERVLDPLVATAGFAYGELVWDRESRGHQWKSRLNTFPPMVKQECRRAVLAHRQAYLTDLRTLMGPADWFKFHCTLVEALRTTVRALFALHEVYYPGDKWLRQSIIRFGLGEEVLTCFGRLFEAQGSAPERASEQHAALLRLMDLVEEDEAGKAGKLQPCQSEHVCAKREAVVTDFPIGQPPYMLGGRFVTVTLVYHSFPDRSARSRLLPVLSTAQPTAAKARVPAAVPGPLSLREEGLSSLWEISHDMLQKSIFRRKTTAMLAAILVPEDASS